MKFVNIFRFLIITLFIGLVIPATTKAVTTTAASYNIVTKDTTGSAEVYSKLVTRLSEIESMDKQNLTAGEKKNLRNELKDMKKAADGLDSKVYLSVGAIIIIILLLILILR